MDKWYDGFGNNSDVVISSRIRLSRNLADTPFPSKMNDEMRKTTNKKIFAAIKNSQFAGELNLIDMNDVSHTKAQAMVEKHIITNDFIDAKNNSGVIVSNDENVSIMLCEEDHIKLQVLRSGQNLDEAFDIANKIDDELSSHLKIAFHKDLGFLTSCPTNLGTGMRASVILHLPALAAKGQVGSLSAMVNKLGLTLRNAFLESEYLGASMFQLSNQITLGISEQNAIDNLNAICDQIVKQERVAREELKRLDDTEDKVYRAMGTLKMARKLSTSEFLNLISLVRLGISLGYFDVKYETIGKLIIKMQNGNLMTDANADLTPELSEKLRADLVRKALD